MSTTLSRRASCAALLLASAAFAEPPSIHDRGLLPGDLAIGPAANSQLELSISRGGNQFLIAWTDMRGAQSGSQTNQSDADVFGIRLDANGNAIDATPFLIAGGMGYQRRPRLAWNGEKWLVLYESQDPTTPPVTYWETRIRAVRVSPAGDVLDSTPLALPPDLFEPSTIGLSLSGQNGQWLVTRCVYHSDGYGTFLAGQRINSAGQLLDAAPVMLNDWVYGAVQAIPSNGEYLVFGPDWNTSALTARRIGANLQPLAASFNLPVNATSITGNGAGEYYVTWIANFTDLAGSRMTSTGTLLNPSGTLLVPSFAGEMSTTHDGTNWWLAWSVVGAKTMRISPTGTVLDPGGVTLPITITGSVTSLYSTRIAPRPGGGALFAWADLRGALGNDANVFAMPLSPANAPSPERCVSTSVRNERNSDLCLGPAGTSAIVYAAEHANDDRVLVNFLNARGTALRSEPIEVHADTSIGRVGIAWNGSIYLIAFDTSTGVKARRMNPDGTFIDASPFAVMPGFNAAVGALGEDFLVAGARFITFQSIGLYGNRIDGPSGTIQDGSNGMYLGGLYVTGAPRVRTDASQWYVTSHSQWTHDSSQGDALLAKVPPTGTPAPAFNPTPISGGCGDLDIAFSPTSALLVWRTNSLANANNYISGRIMNLDGTYATGMFTIAEATARQLRPTATWDGTTFIVAWDDQRNQLDFYDERTDVYAARVSATGTLLDSPAFPIVAARDAECSPSLASTNGRTYISSTRFDVTPPHNAYRIGVSVVGALPCPADLDNGTGAGLPDDGVDINDLIYFLTRFELGDASIDLDDGSNTGTPDGGVDINDLVYFLRRFELGC